MGRIMEQRFKLEKDTEWWFVQDNTLQVNEFGYRDDLNGEDKYRGLQQDLTEQEVVDLLNKLYDENQRLKLENDGLRYALKNIKRIDVEIDIDDINDRE